MSDLLHGMADFGHACALLETAVKAAVAAQAPRRTVAATAAAVASAVAARLGGLLGEVQPAPSSSSMKKRRRKKRQHDPSAAPVAVEVEVMKTPLVVPAPAAVAEQEASAAAAVAVVEGKATVAEAASNEYEAGTMEDDLGVHRWRMVDQSTRVAVRRRATVDSEMIGTKMFGDIVVGKESQ